MHSKIAGPEVFHWRAKDELGNFGDALTVLYQRIMLNDVCLFRSGVVHLVGSVISENRIEKSFARSEKLFGRGQAIFWGCGKKDANPLPRDLISKSIFLGVRGPRSRQALDLPRQTPIGDTALLCPRFYRPKLDARTAGQVLWVPHVHHAPINATVLESAPASIVLNPAIPNTAEACQDFIDAIASARFVMANAMHAAVIALAYGVPFSFWTGSYVNHPFKWHDFAEGVGFQAPFATSFRDGVAAYDRCRPDRAFGAWDAAPLLSVCPYGVRPEL
jgi:hypothetical protein